MADANTSVESTKGWTPEEMEQIEANTIDHDIFCDRLFEQLEAAPPFFDKEEMYKLEESIQRDQMRRASFAIASLSGKELCEKVVEDREFAVIAGGVLSELGAIKERYQQLTNIFSGLEGRLMIALCSREDMNEVIAEGKATLFE